MYYLLERLASSMIPINVYYLGWTWDHMYKSSHRMTRRANLKTLNNELTNINELKNNMFVQFGMRDATENVRSTWSYNPSFLKYFLANVHQDVRTYAYLRSATHAECIFSWDLCLKARHWFLSDCFFPAFAIRICQLLHGSVVAFVLYFERYKTGTAVLL